MLICGAAVSTRLQRTAVPHTLLGRQSILICLWVNSSSSCVTMGCLQSRPQSQVLNLWNSRFHKPWRVVSHVFARTQSILILLGRQVENKGSSFFTNWWHKTKTAVLCKWMAQDKDSSPLQMNTTRQGPQSFANKSRRQGPQSFANEYQFAGTVVLYACEWTAVPHILQWGAYYRDRSLKC